MLNNALAPSSETLKAVDQQLVAAPVNQPFYMLLLGSDSREGSGTSTSVTEQGDQQRSDVIMLARIDAPNKQVTLVTVPRDTPYTMPDGSVQKINETYNVGGAALTIKAVSEVTGAPISHYANVHISELEAIVDSLGGIEVHVDRQLTVKDALTGETIVLSEGTQTLNGQQAQAFVRARHEYNKKGESQDGSRQSNVRTFTQAVVKKVLDRPVTELPGTILNLAQYVETDLTAADLVSLGVSFAGGGLKMYSCTGPTEGYTAEEYGGIWLCYPNPEGWAELMRQVDAGLEPKSIDYESTQIVPNTV
ncbi:MAG: LCP family protein [Eggerthellaceae bacterium]|nr:LCP family protein [Eggerthellaceae bacterium]